MEFKKGDKVLITKNGARGTIVGESIISTPDSRRYVIKRNDNNHFVFGYYADELVKES